MSAPDRTASRYFPLAKQGPSLHETLWAASGRCPQWALSDRERCNFRPGV
jgi:hypothetical protein